MQLLGQGTAKGGSLAGHGVVQFSETPGTIVFYVIIGLAFVCSVTLSAISS